MNQAAADRLEALVAEVHRWQDRWLTEHEGDPDVSCEDVCKVLCAGPCGAA